MHNLLNRCKFETTEIIYIWLSFIVKAFLAMDVFAGLKASSSSSSAETLSRPRRTHGSPPAELNSGCTLHSHALHYRLPYILFITLI